MATVTFADNQQAQIEASVNDSQAAVTMLEYTEGLSELYSATFEFTHKVANTPLVLHDIIGTDCCVGIRSKVSNSTDWETRRIHGIIKRLSYLGEVDDPSGNTGDTLSRYRVWLAPKMWFLTQTTNCRIFQQQTVSQIVTNVLGEYGITVNVEQLTDGTPAQDFRVQYNETDFDFISRLMEESGFFYYFKHGDESVELFLSNQLSGYYIPGEAPAEAEEGDQAPIPPVLRFGNATTGSVAQHIRSWTHDCEFRPESFGHGDYNYRNAGTDLSLQSRPSTLTYPGKPTDTTASLYEYPGGFSATGGDGDAVADLTQGLNRAEVRIEEQEASHEVIEGAGSTISMSPAGKFTLAGHGLTAENSTYVVRTVRLATKKSDGTQPAAGTAVFSFFTCLPDAVAYRPPRRTPKPVVRGPQTAIVTHSTGNTDNNDELDGDTAATVNTDSQGRVRVRFHWDRTGTDSDSYATSSCKVRVSQSWAGKGYGSLLLPHVGHEVVVSFLDGDPDRPLITGRVYNSDNSPPAADGEVVSNNPNRAVVAQDEVGNVIILDADEKRVDIQNAEDKFELTVGTSVTATAGMDIGITLGCGIGINLGAAVNAELAASYSLAFGWSTSVFFGGTWNASIGADFTYAKGRYVNAGDSLGQIAFNEAADFVSKASVSLAGGSGANNSVVHASSDYLYLSYGVTDPSFEADYSMPWGLFLTALLGSAGAAAAGATAFLGATASDKGEFDGHAGGAVATGIGSVAASAAAAILLQRYASAWTTLNPSVHATPESTVILDADGVHALANVDVSLYAGANIMNYATAEFTVNSPVTNVSGDMTVAGRFEAPNILDMGNPAAAAATLQQVQAGVAAARAAAAAAAAQQAAARVAAEAAAAAQDGGEAPV
ncbi:MAG: type VI secretion system tip protein TssI/VgrG [Fuerstiella sp.]